MIKNDMREKAEKFIIDWRGTKDERAEAQSFTNDFFNIFGLDRKKLANFEKSIQKKDESGTGFADLFWSGKLIIESKSAHLDSPKNWEKTLKQATEYIENLLPHQKPQYILLMNFKRIQKYKVIVNQSNKIKIEHVVEVPLEKLASMLDEFAFFIEFANRLESDEEKVNQQAANLMANVYNAIERKGYESNDIAILLARILFCLFAEDTKIFETKQFENFIKNNTTGKTLGSQLLLLFEILNTPNANRKNVNEVVNKFPYVNGGLFDNKLGKVPHTTDALKEALLDCCAYDWSDISPVIFGSLFQAVMNDIERRSLGAHYTSEKNILRVLRPMFLDDLQNEFDELKPNATALENFRKKINGLTFLDPACGCGNFIVVAYRELRLLDIEFIRKKYNNNIQLITDSSLINNVHLDNFYGYEIDPTSAMIAEVAMWLTQHQMNMRLESQFGKAIPTIPLHEAANISNKNSLHINWEGKKKFVKGKGDENIVFDYIVGNPPFIGKKEQTTGQKKDLKTVFKDFKGASNLDYVTAWYVKACEYMLKNPFTQSAFVSTNSIAQGEQVGVFWKYIKGKFNAKINFAHQTFKWTNEAQGIAGVHCVIIGFSLFDSKEKKIFIYNDIKEEPTQIISNTINSYLVPGKDIFIESRNNSICNLPNMNYGSMPIDKGYLTFTDEEKLEFLKKEPNSKKFLMQYTGGKEFINGKKRWCLWLTDFLPNELKESSEVMKRISDVKKFRESSDRLATQKLASESWLFGERRQPDSSYILIPKVSSENRKYIPIGFYPPSVIASGSCLIIPNADLFTFGILTSTMHMTWMRYVCGRLESRYQYSASIVYNNFPFAKEVSEKKKETVEKLAQTILDIRTIYLDKGNTLANLYGDLMPVDLQKAHQLLDKAVDKCYRDTSFLNEPKRMEYLFELYENYTADLFTKEKVQKKKTIL